jgi:hypothetical protein
MTFGKRSKITAKPATLKPIAHAAIPSTAADIPTQRAKLLDGSGGSALLAASTLTTIASISHSDKELPSPTSLRISRISGIRASLNASVSTISIAL